MPEQAITAVVYLRITLTATLRELWGNPNPVQPDSLAGQEPGLVTIVWVILFIVIFGPLAVRRYRRLSR